MNGVNGWAGWQWVFLLEGIPSILAGIVTLLYLTDRPPKADWLTPEQRALVEADLARDAAALGHREHRIMASLKDIRVWQCIAIFFCIVMANSALTFFGPSVVRDAGFTDPLTVGWIMSAAYLCGGAGMILNGRHSDRDGRSPLHCGVPAIDRGAGHRALGFLIRASPVLALIALTVAIVGTMSAIPVFWQIPGRFLAGSAAAAGIALINSVANLAGFGAPARDGLPARATGSVSLGLWLVAAFELATILLILAFIPPAPRNRSRPGACRPRTGLIRAGPVAPHPAAPEEDKPLDDPSERHALTRRSLVGAGSSALGGAAWPRRAAALAQGAPTAAATGRADDRADVAGRPRPAPHHARDRQLPWHARRRHGLRPLVLRGRRLQAAQDGHHAAQRPPGRPLLVDDGLKTGRYELLMHFEDYFARLGVKLPSPNFLSLVPIRFQIRDAGQRYHLPVLFTPWGYSYYRGS